MAARNESLDQRLRATVMACKTVNFQIYIPREKYMLLFCYSFQETHKFDRYL